MVDLPIYLDNNATTRTDPAVVDEMLPFFSSMYGNPSSKHHSMGRDADRAIKSAREKVAMLIGAKAKEIVFTSGATESNNIALKGVLPDVAHQNSHLITCTTEHKAILDPSGRLERLGVDVTYLAVDETGILDPAALDSAITQNTKLVSIMLANNETGVLQPISQMGEICKAKGVWFHCDATQAAGKVPIDVESLNVDLLSLSAHKFYGPKGVGCLYVRSRNPRVRLTPMQEGGGQERGIRSGTLAVPNIVGMGKAAELAKDKLTEEPNRLSSLRDQLQKGITTGLSGVAVNGDQDRRLPNTTNLSFDGVDGEALMLGMENIILSAGSACTSTDPEPSYVLRAMGFSDDRARSSLRFAIGRFTTSAEVEFAVQEVCRVVTELRAMTAGCDISARSV